MKHRNTKRVRLNLGVKSDHCWVFSHLGTVKEIWINPMQHFVLYLRWASFFGAVLVILNLFYLICLTLHNQSSSRNLWPDVWYQIQWELTGLSKYTSVSSIDCKAEPWRCTLWCFCILLASSCSFTLSVLLLSIALPPTFLYFLHKLHWAELMMQQENIPFGS